MSGCTDRVGRGRAAPPFPRKRAVFAVCLAILAAAACDPQGALVRERMKAVERGLMPVVYLKGLRPARHTLAERMAFYRVPGVSLAVIDKNAVEWARAYGERDAQTHVPMTPDTVLQAGGLSQVVAAAAAMTLVESGTVGLDEEIAPRLKTWSFPRREGAAGPGITLRALMSHSAGLLDQVFEGSAPEEPVPSLTEVLEGAKPALNAPVWMKGAAGPVGRARYAEGHYVVLERLLEDVAGAPFAEFARRAVLDPLEMGSSSFEIPLPEPLRARAASGHLREGEVCPGSCRIYPEKAAKGLWTTASDFAGFLSRLVRLASGAESGILSSPSARALLSSQADDFGFGFLAQGGGDDLVFKFRGRTKGFSAFAVLYPVRGQGAVVMTNSDNGAVLIDEILAALGAAYKWPHFEPEEKDVLRLAPETYREYAGRYEVNPGYALDVRWEDYYLVIQPTGQAPTRFYAEGQTLFYSTDPYIRIQFLRARDGRTEGLVLWQQDFQVEAKKVSRGPRQ